MTTNGRKRETETTDYAAMMRRMIRAHGRRVADADEADLAELVELRDALEEAIADAVAGQRRQLGSSWAVLAPALRITRQAAQQKYGARCAHGRTAASRQAHPCPTGLEGCAS